MVNKLVRAIKDGLNAIIGVTVPKVVYAKVDGLYSKEGDRLYTFEGTFDESQLSQAIKILKDEVSGYFGSGFTTFSFVTFPKRKDGAFHIE